MVSGWSLAALAAAAVAILSIGVAASTGHVNAPWSGHDTGGAAPMHGGQGGHEGKSGHGGGGVQHGSPGGQQAGQGGSGGGCGCPANGTSPAGHGMASGEMHGMHGGVHEGRGHGMGGAGSCMAGQGVVWNGTASVVEYDASARVLVLQLDNGTNVTVKLAREYVRASDGVLVYGGWLAGEAASEGTVWVSIAAGHSGHPHRGASVAGVVAEIHVGGEAYILPALYASGP